jgi:SNF2 family DNA or RNA helicase
MGVDVVICSYEYLETHYRAFEELVENIGKYSSGQHRKHPERYTSAIYSWLFQNANLPIKRLILDEAHRTKNIRGKRFQAVKALYYHSIIMLTGTMFDNKWSDIRALLFLLKGHAFPDAKAFRRFFFTYDYNEVREELRPHSLALLSRVLLAFTIARPGDVIELPGCIRWRHSFELNQSELALVEHYAACYGLDIKKNSGSKGKQTEEEEDNALGHAVKAQLAATHLCLLSISGDQDDEQYNMHIMKTTTPSTRIQMVTTCPVTRKTRERRRRGRRGSTQRLFCHLIWCST